MRKAKFLRLKQIIRQINDPTLKRFDRLHEVASLPGIDLQEFLNAEKRINGTPSEKRVPVDHASLSVR